MSNDLACRPRPEEAGLVPHAQAIDLVEWVRRVERQHDNARRGGGESLDCLHARQGEETDHEGDGRRASRVIVRQDLVQGGNKEGYSGGCVEVQGDHS